MSFATRAAALALTGLLLSGTAVFAQGVGGADVPSDAKKQGEKEQPGSTGMSKDGGGAMKKSGGSMSGGSSGTGGANGGSSSKAGADGAGK